MHLLILLLLLNRALLKMAGKVKPRVHNVTPGQHLIIQGVVTWAGRVHVEFSLISYLDTLQVIH